MRHLVLLLVGDPSKDNVASLEKGNVLLRGVSFMLLKMNFIAL